MGASSGVIGVLQPVYILIVDRSNMPPKRHAQWFMVTMTARVLLWTAAHNI